MTQAQEICMPKIPSSLQKAHVGYEVQDAATGARLISIQAHHLYTPASTLKVITTEAALSLYGKEHCFATRVYLRGRIIADRLKGDIIIVGEGDPSIGSRYLGNKEKLFEQVTDSIKALGIKHIEGSIVALSPREQARSANFAQWLHYDMGNYYGAPAYDLNVFDNSYTVHFAEHGRTWRIEPEISGLTLIREYAIAARNGGDSLYITIPHDAAKEGQRIITGVYPAGEKRVSIRGAIPNPPHFLAQYLTKALRERGISVAQEGSTTAILPTEELQPLCTYLSPTLETLARLTNTYSINLFAEALLRLVARDGTPLAGHDRAQTGLMRARQIWSERGLPLDEYSIVDGSGLSPQSRVSPYFLASLLGKSYRSDPDHTLMMTLPIAGREGSVTSFLKKTALEGGARLKSGTVRHAIGYAGYVITPNGKVYSVAIFVNNYTAPTSVIRKGISQMLLDTFGDHFPASK